jgi:hypothetical protein
MATTFLIMPEDDDHYRACGCSNCGPLPCLWGFGYERRPGTNSFQRSANPDEDMGEFLCSGCMMHNVWWATKVVPGCCCLPNKPPGLPTAAPRSHAVPAELLPPGQLGGAVTVTPLTPTAG